MAKCSKPHATDTCTPVFTVVRIVCGSEARVATLPHVVTSVSSFLGRICPEWTLESESQSGKIWRLNLLVGTEWPGVGHSFRKARFEYALRNSVTKGKVDVLEWWMQHYGLPERYGDPKVRAFARAVDYGSLSVLEWLRAQGNLPAGPFKTQIVCRDLHIAQWIHLHAPNTRLVVDPDMDLDFIRWAHEHQHHYEIKNASYLVDRAIALGKLADLQWLHANCPERCSDNALGRVLRNGNLDVATWLYEKYPRGFFLDPVDVYEGWNRIEWISTHYEWTDASKRDKWVRNCIRFARTDGGFVKVVTHLYDRQFKDQGDAMMIAACQGDLNMVNGSMSIKPTRLRMRWIMLLAMGT